MFSTGAMLFPSLLTCSDPCRCGWPSIGTSPQCCFLEDGISRNTTQTSLGDDHTLSIILAFKNINWSHRISSKSDHVLLVLGLSWVNPLCSATRVRGGSPFPCFPSVIRQANMFSQIFWFCWSIHNSYFISAVISLNGKNLKAFMLTLSSSDFSQPEFNMLRKIEGQWSLSAHKLWPPHPSF